MPALSLSLPPLFSSPLRSRKFPSFRRIPIHHCSLSLPQEQRVAMPSRCEIFCEILIAILLPPLGVCFRHGCCSVEFWICVLLTVLGYIPGIIYALYAIAFVNREEFFDEARRPLYA